MGDSERQRREVRDAVGCPLPPAPGKGSGQEGAQNPSPDFFLIFWLKMSHFCSNIFAFRHGDNAYRH